MFKALTSPQCRVLLIFWLGAEILALDANFGLPDQANGAHLLSLAAITTTLSFCLMWLIDDLFFNQIRLQPQITLTYGYNFFRRSHRLTVPVGPSSPPFQTTILLSKNQQDLSRDPDLSLPGGHALPTEYSSSLSRDEISEPTTAVEPSAAVADLRAAGRTILAQPHLRKLLPFDMAQIYLYREETADLTLLLRLTKEEWPQKRICGLDEGYTGWIAKTQTALHIEDVQQFSDIQPTFDRSTWPFQSFIGVPLIIGSKLLGTLEMAVFAPHKFTLQEVTVLETIAGQTAIVLENTRLFSVTNRQLQVRVDELDGLQRVSSELNSTLDLSTILGTVLEEALRVTQADFGNVYFYNATTTELIPYRDPPESQSNQTSNGRVRSALSAKSGTVGQVIQSGKSSLVPDVTQDKDYIHLGYDVRSKVVVPILYAGEPVGIINLESCQTNFFSDTQLRYLELLANQTAVAIGNAEAYHQQKLEREQASRRADQLLRLAEISNTFRTNRPLSDVLEDIAFAIADSVGYDVVSISLVRDDPPLLYHEVGMGIPLAQLAQLRQPAQARPLSHLQDLMLAKYRQSDTYFIPAADKVDWQAQLNIPFIEKSVVLPRPASQSDSPHLTLNATRREPWQSGDLLLVPLRKANETIIGLLAVQNPVDENRPDMTSIKALETFANHAASAIENAQLFKLEQERRQLADTLRGVSEMISSHLETEQLLQLVLQELRKVIDHDRSTVELLEDRHLVIIGGQGWEEYSRQIIGLSFSMTGNNPSRRVLETQEPFIVKDARIEYSPIFSAPPYDRVRSWLGVPLTYGTNILGLMAVGSHKVDFFTEEDAQVVLAFANQVAIALQNAHLFEEARRQVRQLEALTEVAGSLNQALELDQVLNLVLDAVFDLVGHSNGSIWLIDRSTGTVKIANTHNVPHFLVEEFNRSNTSIETEPFASVIRSGQVLIMGGDKRRDKIAPEFGVPFPDDVTYVPLKTEEGVIGILAMETVVSSRGMLDLVTTLADLAAVAIDRARLLADTRARATEMQSLYKLGVDISEMLEVRQVMHSVILNVLHLLGGQIGVILFWDEQIEQYIFEGAAVTPQLAARFGLERMGMVQIKPDDTQHPMALWARLTEQIIHSSRPVLSDLTITRWAKNETIQDKDPLPSDEITRGLGLQTILGAPIQLQSQVAGAIFVGTLHGNSFGERHGQTLSFVSTQAAVAVRNAQLVQRLNLLTENLEQRVQQRTEELAQTLQELTDERDRMEVLYELGRQLTSSFNLEEVLHHALNLLNGAIGISQGNVLLLDPATGYLNHRAAIGRDKPLPPEGSLTRFKVGVGLAGKVMASRRPRLIPELTQEPDWLFHSPILHRRSALVVPLTTGDDVLGALLLFHPEANYFSEDHLKLVTTAAAQIATAINNAELYRVRSEQAGRLAVMYQQQAAETAKNEAILKGIADGVLVLDTQRQIVLVNPKAAEILNIDAAELTYRPLSQILENALGSVEAELVQLLYDQLDQSLTQIEAGMQAVEFRISAGPKVVRATLTPVTLKENEPPSTVAVLRDISRDAEIDRLKNEFISSVSHELRTPMTSIKGYADLLLSGNNKIGELNPMQYRFVKVIQSNTNRLSELVNDILEISRIETGKIKLEFETINLAEIVQDVARTFEGQMFQKFMHLMINLPVDLPPVYADRARLTQILVNLVGNAWQYTPESGNIEIHAKTLDRLVQVDVADNGIGIVEQDKQYLFDRFFRSERNEVQVVDGTGLGLSITKSFVEMLGGQIWVESQVDVGSTFSFTVPIAVSEQNDDTV
ncbi:MAG: GAF domain-containing protein [Anaerolineales bacterium]|nr:GAF domain-containing protein [Anaerolineales bacterium]